MMKIEEVAAFCGRQGLRLKQAQEVGSVLVLRPDRAAELPGLDVLQGIARELERAGFRYVTLDLDGYGGGGVDG